MTKSDHFVANVQSPHRVIEDEVVIAILEASVACFPDHLPQRIGSEEPIRHRFDQREVGRNLDYCDHGFMATGPSIWLSADPREDNQYRTHSKLSLEIESDRSDISAALIRFVMEIYHILGLDFACAFSRSCNEVDTGYANGTFFSRDGMPSFVIPRPTFYRYTPDLYWLNVFGPPYTRRFGVERFLKAPVHRAELLDEATVLVQLTPDARDAVSNPVAFAACRDEAKRAIGPNLFWHPGKTEGYEPPDWPPVPDELMQAWQDPPAYLVEAQKRWEEEERRSPVARIRRWLRLKR
jgi:hypothetical protein